MLLAASGAIMLGLAVFSVFDFGIEEAPNGTALTAPPAVHDSRRVENPRYTARLPNGNPLFVSADWAIPDGVEPDRIRLSNVVARSEGAEGGTTTAKADTGFLYPTLNRFVLAGQVHYFGADGARFESDRLSFDANDRTVRSAGPVLYESTDSRLTAGSMLLRESATGRRLVFAGGVHATYQTGIDGDGS